MKPDRLRRWWGLYLINGRWEIHSWEHPPSCMYRMQVRVGDYRRAQRMRKEWNKGRAKKLDEDLHGDRYEGKPPLPACPRSDNPRYRTEARTPPERAHVATQRTTRRGPSLPAARRLGLPGGRGSRGPVRRSAMTVEEAIGKARAKMKSPKKDKTASMGQGRTYRYASLESVLDSVLPALTEHGITLLQPCSMGDGVVHVTTRLQLGEDAVETTLSAPLSRGGFHEMGSAITYLRRYGLSSLLAISADEDEDGHAAEAVAVAGNKTTRKGAVTKDRTSSAMTDSPAQAPRRAAQPRAFDQESNVEILRGTLEKVYIKEGKNAKGPWVRYACKVEGFDDWVSTFEEALGQRAVALEGQTIRLQAVATGKGWNVGWIEADADEDPQAVADAAIAADKAEAGDDLPF